MQSEKKGLDPMILKDSLLWYRGGSEFKLSSASYTNSHHYRNISNFIIKIVRILLILILKKSQIGSNSNRMIRIEIQTWHYLKGFRLILRRFPLQEGNNKGSFNYLLGLIKSCKVGPKHIRFPK